jgi:PAS domain S-box-containing protein
MQRLLQFVGNTGDGLYAVDGEQRIALWNSAAECVLGYKADEVLGRHCYEVIRGSDETGCRVCMRECSTIRAVLRRQLVEARDLRVRDKNGREVWLNVSTTSAPSLWRHRAALYHSFRPVRRGRKIGSTRSSRAVTSAPPRPRPRHAKERMLTNREREILGLLAAGTTTADMARRLFISPTTVRNHVRNILRKLGAHSRLEAVVLAMKHRVL